MRRAISGFRSVATRSAKFIGGFAGACCLPVEWVDARLLSNMAAARTDMNHPTICPKASRHISA
jgi:hypothetical protein